jgi:hypothetical protein
MIRIEDLRLEAYRALTEIPYAQYMCVMAAVCSSLVAIYSDYSPPSIHTLLPQTEQLLDSVARNRSHVGTGQAPTAADIAEAWGRFLDEPDVVAPAEVQSAWICLEAISSELAGTQPQFAAAGRAIAALGVQHPSRLDTPRGSYIYVDPDREVDEAFFGVRTLRGLLKCIQLSKHEECEIDTFRTLILPDGPQSDV